MPRNKQSLRAIESPPVTSRYCYRANLILQSAHSSAASLLEAFHLARSQRGKSRGGTTDKEQDLLRAMIVMAAAGLDSMLKQLIRDALPRLVERHKKCKGGLEKFISRQIKGDGEGPAAIVGHGFLARILAAPKHQTQVIEEYIRHLTTGSLQSPDELYRAAAALGLEESAIGVGKDSMKKIFDIRNKIVHELDINLDAERRSRNIRKLDDMISHTNDLLKIAEKMRDGAEQLAVATTKLPSSTPPPRQFL